MIRAFNKHYRKAFELLEDSSSSDKIEMAEKVIEWFRELPEEYLISLALFFNEVIDDLGDESLEKINFKPKRKSKDSEEEDRRGRNMMRKKTTITMMSGRTTDGSIHSSPCHFQFSRAFIGKRERPGYKPSVPSFRSLHAWSLIGARDFHRRSRDPVHSWAVLN